MHLFALDPSGRIIPAKQASRQQNYMCLECRGVVRRRGGRHRVPHFFHLNPPESCRQQGKSLVHLQVQCRLQAWLPAGEVMLEYAFPEVRRIADAAWLNQKILFEVQCSFITPDEIRERQEDYLSQGFTVVWILHDSRYNQWRLTAAEDFLQGIPHYFTNINAEGQGWIYDQYQLLKNGIRQKKFPPLIIDPGQPVFFNGLEKDALPFLIRNRAPWPFYFKGDAWDQRDQHREWGLEHYGNKEPRKNRVLYYLGALYASIMRFYILLFRVLLEKICK